MPSPDELSTDERAIEGLPIRLVIALVVGVASLALMMNMLGGLGGGLQENEVTTDLNGTTVIEQGSVGDGDGDGNIDIKIVDENGEPVEGATVILKSGTATLPDTQTATTDSDGVAEFDHSVFNSVTFQSSQDQGTLVVDVQPPSNGDYKDDKDNDDIVVIKN